MTQMDEQQGWAGHAACTCNPCTWEAQVQDREYLDRVYRSPLSEEETNHRTKPKTLPHSNFSTFKQEGRNSKLHFVGHRRYLCRGDQILPFTMLNQRSLPSGVQKCQDSLHSASCCWIPCPSLCSVNDLEIKRPDLPQSISLLSLERCLLHKMYFQTTDKTIINPTVGSSHMHSALQERICTTQQHHMTNSAQNKTHLVTGILCGLPSMKRPRLLPLWILASTPDRFKVPQF